MERNARQDLPLLAAAVVGLIVAGAITFASVAAATPDETFDSNSPNATTPGPASSFNIR